MSRKYDIEQSVDFEDVFELRLFVNGQEKNWRDVALRMVLRHPVRADVVVAASVNGNYRRLTLPRGLARVVSKHSWEVLPWRYEIEATNGGKSRVLVSGALIPAQLTRRATDGTDDKKKYLVDVYAMPGKIYGKVTVYDMPAWEVRVAEAPGKHACDNVTSSVTSGSTALITSGGVYTGLSGKQDKLEYDAKPVKDSGNAVTSGAIYTAIEEAKAAAVCNMPESWVGLATYPTSYAMALGHSSRVKTSYSTAVGCFALSERQNEMKIVAGAEDASYPHGLELVLHVTGCMPGEPDGDGFYAAGMGNLEFSVFERGFGEEGALRKREKVTISAKAFMQMLIAAGGVKSVE